MNFGMFAVNVKLNRYLLSEVIHSTFPLITHVFSSLISS